MNGKGVYRIQTPEGNESYTGEFKENQFHGEGLYVFADGGSYQGQWANNHMEGMGCYSDTSGERWSGTFVDGRYSSQQQRSKTLDNSPSKVFLPPTS